jgi:hypothetical protein
MVFRKICRKVTKSWVFSVFEDNMTGSETYTKSDVRAQKRVKKGHFIEGVKIQGNPDQKGPKRGLFYEKEVKRTSEKLYPVFSVF